MRLIIEFNPVFNGFFDDVNKYHIQSFIYSLLNETYFEKFHDTQGFKFFNFSNIFLVSDFKHGEYKKLIISSPDSKFIRTLYKRLLSMNFFSLGKNRMEIIKIRLLKCSCSNSLITGTPIVLFEENIENKYVSFQRESQFNIDFFFERLKDNAIKKYISYTKKDLDENFDIFDSFVFNREVSVRIKMHNRCFVVIGSLWNELEKDISREYKNFYNFIFDVGLGEKNGLGFGFINNRR